MKDHKLSNLAETLPTEFVGRRIYYFETIDSTNSEADRLARGGVEEGVVVLAEAQTRGKGRAGRMWDSPGGVGLWFSVVLRPPSPLEQIYYIPLLAAVAVAESIRNVTSLSPTVKYPNDVRIDGKKVCGILAETRIESGRALYAILGIGVNVNQDEFPPELRRRAISLKMAKGEPIDRAQLLCEILIDLERWYKAFTGGDLAAIRRGWTAISDTIGSDVGLKCGKEIIRGRAVGLSEDGSLAIRSEDGKIFEVMPEEIIITRSGKMALSKLLC
ncbi:MAG: biotin--[acetyl-CoA-carboxylase] ligase [bacterium]